MWFLSSWSVKDKQRLDGGCREAERPWEVAGLPVSAHSPRLCPLHSPLMPITVPSAHPQDTAQCAQSCREPPLHAASRSDPHHVPTKAFVPAHSHTRGRPVITPFSPHSTSKPALSTGRPGPELGPGGATVKNHCRVRGRLCGAPVLSTFHAVTDGSSHQPFQVGLGTLLSTGDEADMQRHESRVTPPSPAEPAVSTDLSTSLPAGSESQRPPPGT